MSELQIFNSADSKERETWIRIWQEWPEREVFAHPAYLQLFARSCDCCLCACVHNEQGTILFPFILRPIAAEPWAGDCCDGIFDMTSPYGYGGPFFWGRPDAQSFWCEFEEWARNSKAVSLYVRMSLFEKQLISFDGSVIAVSKNVVRDLNSPADDIWKDYEYKVRKNVNKAQRSGLRLIRDETGSGLDDFLKIYQATMERRMADEYYRFSRDFFNAIVQNFPRHFVFFHCMHDDIMVSTELVLVSASHIYSFLGGTLPDYFSLRPNDLIKHSIIQWGRETGRTAFVLGGGQQENDGIFQFKRSFAPHGVVPYYIGSRIYDQEFYNMVIKCRQEHARKQGLEWQPRSGFFPAYRW